MLSDIQVSTEAATAVSISSSSIQKSHDSTQSSVDWSAIIENFGLSTDIFTESVIKKIKEASNTHDLAKCIQYLCAIGKKDFIDSGTLSLLINLGDTLQYWTACISYLFEARKFELITATNMQLMSWRAAGAYPEYLSGAIHELCKSAKQNLLTQETLNGLLCLGKSAGYVFSCLRELRESGRQDLITKDALVLLMKGKEKTGCLASLILIIFKRKKQMVLTPLKLEQLMWMLENVSKEIQDIFLNRILDAVELPKKSVSEGGSVQQGRTMRFSISVCNLKKDEMNADAIEDGKKSNLSLEIKPSF